MFITHAVETCLVELVSGSRTRSSRGCETTVEVLIVGLSEEHVGVESDAEYVEAEVCYI